MAGDFHRLPFVFVRVADECPDGARFFRPAHGRHHSTRLIFHVTGPSGIDGVNSVQYAKGPMSLYERLLRPILFRLDAERAHNAAIAACRLAARSPRLLNAIARHYTHEDPRLATTVAG